VAEEKGQCPRCGKALEQVPGSPPSHPALLRPRVLALSAEAVLTTGRRQLVYLEVEPGRYRLIEPVLGPRAGDYYPVVSGLKEGDRVVTRGSFLLDSQFQITGKASLLYPKRDAAAAAADGLTAKQRANFEKLPEADRQPAIAQRICPGCGMNVAAMGPPHKMELNGRVIYLCCKGCEQAVRKDPEAALKKIEATKPAPTPEDPMSGHAQPEKAGEHCSCESH
jgi:YHS domain-containing protein